MDRQEFIDLMREVITAQDTATHANEHNLPDALLEAQNNRDAARGALLAEYDRLAGELAAVKAELPGLLDNLAEKGDRLAAGMMPERGIVDCAPSALARVWAKRLRKED